MTVIFSKKCEYGVQAVLYLAAQKGGIPMSADEISKVLKIPKEFISKILRDLKESRLIYSSRGKSGGFGLAKDPANMKLIDVVEAIDGLEMFNSCILGFPECTPKAPCPIHNIWDALRIEVYDMLTAETLDKLKTKTLEKIASL